MSVAQCTQKMPDLAETDSSVTVMVELHYHNRQPVTIEFKLKLNCTK